MRNSEYKQKALRAFIKKTAKECKNKIIGINAAGADGEGWKELKSCLCRNSMQTILGFLRSMDSYSIPRYDYIGYKNTTAYE